MKQELLYERGDLFDVNMIITMIVRVKGSASEEEWKTAFGKAVRANEILLTRIYIEEDGRAYYTDGNSIGSSLRFTEEDLQKVRQREERIRFRIEEGEYLRVFVKPEGEETSVLFLMHHLGGDGKSLLYFIEGFLTFLSGGSVPFREIRTEETKENLDFISRGIIRYYNRRWKKRIFSFEDMDRAYERYWKDRTTTIKTEVIEEAEMERIKDECRRNGVRFTSYLTAKLIRADSEQKKTKDIGYALDYRHDRNRSMGNQASGCSVRYRYNPHKSLMENALEIQKRLDRKLTDHQKGSYILSFVSKITPTLHDAVNLEHAGTFHDKTSYRFAKLMGYVGRTKDYSITNLMVADIPVTYGSFEIKEILFAGPVISYGQRIISVITCNGRTVITTHFREKETEKTDAFRTK